MLAPQSPLMMSVAHGQCCGEAAAPAPVATQTYRLDFQTVYDEQQMTAYRVSYETVYDTKTYTVQKPVWETQMQERRYTVQRPVWETQTREERFTVMKPVYETQVVDRSYDVTRDVVETSTRITGRGRPGINLELDVARWRAVGAEYHSGKWTFVATNLKGEIAASSRTVSFITRRWRPLKGSVRAKAQLPMSSTMAPTTPIA